MNFITTEITDKVNDLRSQLYQTLTAPIDAMWEKLYIGSAQHYLIHENDTVIGYCAINQDDCLLQLFLISGHQSKMNRVVIELLESKLIRSAKLSSNEPISFSACLALSKGIAADTLCFEHPNEMMNLSASHELIEVTEKHIPDVKLFYKEQVGMDDTFGYTENLVARKELFMVKDAGTITAISECRMSDSQSGIADLGIIVHANFRRKGLASSVMAAQVNRVLSLGRKPICSTTVDNLASQKMIEKAGFYCSNIIFDIRLTDDN